MGGHHGIDHVIKMQYMLGCLDEQEKGMRGSSKAPMRFISRNSSTDPFENVSLQ